MTVTRGGESLGQLHVCINNRKWCQKTSANADKNDEDYGEHSFASLSAQPFGPCEDCYKCYCVLRIFSSLL